MAMKVFAVNTVLSAADTNEYLVNTKYVAKGSDTTRSSTTTPVIDPELQGIQVDTNKSYIVEVCLLYNSNSTANFKYRFNAPAGTVLYGSVTTVGFVGGTGTTIGPYTPAGSLPILYNTQQSLIGQAPVSDSVAWITGVLNTGGSAGGFSVAWSQDTSGGSNTIMRTGSFMLVQRVS